MGRKRTYNESLQRLLKKYDRNNEAEKVKNKKATEFATNKKINAKNKTVDCPSWWDNRGWKEYESKNPEVANAWKEYKQAKYEEAKLRREKYKNNRNNDRKGLENASKQHTNRSKHMRNTTQNNKVQG